MNALRRRPLWLLAVVAFTTTCRLDELVSPPPLGQLTVSATAVADSAAVGSTAPRIATLEIANATGEALRWEATTAGGAPWIALAATSGSVPTSVTVTLDPADLDTGVYQDTIVFTSVPIVGSPISIPVEWRITPCAVATVSLDDAVADSLGTSNCSTPRRVGQFSAFYDLTGSAGDSVSVTLLAEGFDGLVALDTARGAAAPLAEGACDGAAGHPCLQHVLLPRDGTYYVEVTSMSPGQTGQFTVRLNAPRPPLPPEELSQFARDSTTVIAVGGSIDDTVVVLSGRVADPDSGEVLQLEVEVRQVGVPFSSAAGDSAAAMTTSSDGVPSGAVAPIQVGELVDNTEYRWRARVRDATGRVSAWTMFGANPDSVADFGVAVREAPNVPADLGQFKIDRVTAVLVGAVTDQATVVLKGTVTDPDPTDSLRLEVEVRPLGTAFSGTPSGVSVAVASGETAEVSVGGLADDTEYHWQARVVDELGVASDWFPFGDNPESEPDFSVAVQEPANPPADLAQFRSDTTTSIGVGDTIPETSVVLTATIADADPTDSVRLEIELRPIEVTFSGAATDSSARIEGGGEVSIAVTNLRDDTGYHWRGRAVDQRGGASAWVSFGGNPDGVMDFRVQVEADELAYNSQPSDVVSGGVIAPPVVVTALEPSGQPDTSYQGTVAIAILNGSGAEGAVLSGATAVQAVNGAATFSDLRVDLAGTGYVLVATAPGLPPVESDPFTVTAAGFDQLTILTQPSVSSQSGKPLAQQPRLQIQDANGNPVPQSGVTVTASIATGPSGGALVNATATTDGQGEAVFANLTIAGPAGVYTLQFSASGLPVVPGNPTTVTAGDAVRLVLSTTPSTTSQSGVPFAQQPVVQIVDGSDNPVPESGTPVTVSIQSGTGTLVGATVVNSDANGHATYTDLGISGVVGSFTLRFEADDLTGVTSPPLTLGPGAAVSIAEHAGNGQTATAGTPVPIPPAVIVTDASGNAVPGVDVAFAVTQGGGNVNPSTMVTTGPDGIAALLSWTLGPAAGANALTATSDGLMGNPVSFTATGVPGTAGQLAIVTQPPTSGRSGEVLSPQPVVRLVDGNGNPVLLEGIVVTAAIASGPGGNLSGTVIASTDSSGVVEFTDIAINGPVGSYALSFTGTGLTGATSNPIVIDAGMPGQLALTTQPSNTAASGAPIAEQPVIQVQDLAGNNVEQAGLMVTATIATGGGTLSGATAVASDASGVVAFTDLAIGGAAGDRTLGFDAVGLIGVVSNTISVSSGSATRVVISTQPSATVQSGVEFPQQPVIQLQDASGNAVAQSDVLVTASIASGAAQLDGTLAVTTDAGGTATFTDLLVSGAIGIRNIEFTATGLAPDTSNAVNVQAGPAAQLSLSAQPSGQAQSGVVFPAQPVVQLQDAFENAVSQANVAITASLATGGGTLNGSPTVLTDANGVASYADLAITGPAGAYTLEFTSGTLTSVTSDAITLGAGQGTRLSITTQPSDTAQNGIAVDRAPVIQLQDGSGNDVRQPGVTVIAVILSGGGTLTNASATTDANGVATFTGLTVTGIVGDRTLIFAASGFESVVSDVVSLVPGTATQLAVSTQPSTPTASSAPFAVQPVVQLQDVSGNAVSLMDVLVTASIGLGSGTLLGTTSATTNASGAVTFVDLAISGLIGSYALDFTAPSLSGVTSETITLTPGVAAQLGIITQPPSSVASGEILAPQPVIQLQDAAGNAVTDAGVPVSASIFTGGGTLGGTVTISTDGNGRALYSDLSITGLLGSRTLRFSASGLAGITTNSIDVTVGVATQLAISVQPSAVASSGVAFPMQPVVQLRDGGGNPVSESGRLVTAAIVSGGGALGGTVTALTDPDGAATFTNLSIAGVIGDRVLSFSASGLAGITSNAISLVAGPGTQLTFLVQPSNQDAGVPIAPAIEVAILDASGNRAVTQTDVVALNLRSGTGTPGAALSGTLSAGAVSGVASFGNVRVDSSGVGYRLDATASGLAPATSTTFAIVPGTATAPQTTAVVPDGVAGSPTVITVQARDSLGNALTTGGDVIAITVTGANPATLSVIDNGDGTYSASYTPTAIGTDDVAITLGGAPIGGSPFTSDVSPGSVDAASSTADVPPGTAGSVTGISVQVRDAFGNPLGESGGVVLISVSGANTSSPTVTDNGDGTYSASYTPTAAGTDAVTITLDGQPVGSSPFNSVVAPGAVSPAASTAIVPSGTAGTATAVTVQARDAFGNPLVTSGGIVTINVSGANSAAPTVTDNNDGTYAASYTPTVSGTDQVAITLNGAPVGASPFASPVSPGPVSAAASTAIVPAGVAGTPTAIVVQARDAFGNPLGASGGVVVVSVTGANTATPLVTDVGDGTYTTSYTPTLIGTDQVSITLDGVPIGGSPFSSAVSPGAVSAAASTAVVPAGTAGSLTPITVQARDANGNPLGMSGGTVVVSVSGANTATPVVTDNGDGTYSTSYTPTSTGTDTVLITLGGDPVGGSPFESLVSPGAVDPAASTATVPAGTAGSVTEISVQARDAFGNPLEASGGVVVINVTGANTATPPVTDNGDGTYTASYTPTVAGSDNVAITLGGVDLGGSPFESIVSPGSVSASASTAVVPAGTAGSPTDITVQARDAFGNPLEVSGGLVTVAVTGANSDTPTVTDNGDGTYTTSYTPTVTGDDAVAITLGGAPLGSSPFTSVVSPGPVNAAASTAVVPAGTAGALTSISVQARDAFGNELGASGGTVVISITGDNTASPTVIDNGDGTYSASYVPTNAGTDNVAITLGGTPLGGSPFTSVVSPGSVSAEASTATVPDGTAGSVTVIAVQARDTLGNQLTSSGGVVTVEVSGANPETLAVTDNGDGTYSASYTPTVAGTDQVAITLGGVPIGDSPFTSEVSVGPAAQYLVTSNDETPVGGSAVTITAQLADAFDNPISSAGLVVTWSSTNGGSFSSPTSTTSTSGIATILFTTSATGGTVHTVTGTDGGGTNGTSGDITTSSITLSTDKVTLAESGANSPANITVSLSAPSERNVTVELSFGGTATLVDDYTRSGTTINISAGSTSGAVTVSAVQDAIDEEDETVLIDFSSISNVAAPPSQVVTVTILDDDAPPIVTFSEPAQSDDESVTPVTVTAQLSAVSGLAVSVPVTLSGTATLGGGADYTVSGTTIAIPAGATSGSLTVTVNDDALDENDETVVLTMGAPTNATVGNPGVQTVTIEDNDAPPVVTFTAGTQTKNENVGTVIVTAQLSAVSGLAVSVPISLSGTATVGAGADYTISGTTIAIPAGSTTGSLTITVNDDALDEDNETAILTMGTPANATVGSPGVQTVTIEDNDTPPTVAFTVGSQSNSESVTFVTVTAQVSAVSGLPVSVPVTLSGSATLGAGADYTVSGTTIVIPAGLTTGSLTITVNNDALDENDETVVVTMGSPTNATLGGTTVHTATIADNDATPTVAWTVSLQTNSEAVSTVTATAQLSAVSGLTVTVPYTVSGTAVNPNDYTIDASPVVIPAGSSSNDVTITVVDDALDEFIETVILTMQTPTNASLGATTVHTARISDNDPQPSVTFTQSSQSNSESVSEVLIVAQLSAVSGRDVIVPFSVGASSTATLGAGADYTLSASPLTILPGSLADTITITVNDDTVDEAAETVIINMGTPTRATAGAITTHTATITDNDAPPTVAWTQASQSNGEGTSSVIVTAQLSAVSELEVTVPFTLSGTATQGAGADYTITSSPITITAGTTTANVAVTVNNDVLDEDDETVIVTMGAPSNATLGGTTVHVATIEDNDAPPAVAFTSGSQVGGEGVGTMTITASLSAVSGLNVTVPFTLGGTATEGAGQDYTVTASPITITAGTLNNTITITVNDDALDENAETVVVTMGNPTNASKGATDVHTATITDNDNVPFVSFTSTGQTVDEGVGTVTVRAQLSAVSGLGVAVPYTLSGTANDPDDYTIDASPLIIPAGQIFGDITITVDDDALDENAEAIIVTMGSPTNAAPTPPTVHTVTITDNDDAPTVTLSVDKTTLAEAGGDNPATVTATLSSVSGLPVTVDLGFTGTATLTSDYTRSSTQIVIPPLSTAGTITINAAPDVVDEPNETVVVDITSVSNGAEQGTQQVTVTVIDDDAQPTVTLSVDKTTLAEDGTDNPATVTATLSGLTSQAVTVDLAYTGGATLTNDYTRSGTQISIPALSTTGTVTVSAVQDAIDEPNEAVVVDIDAVSAGATEAGTQQVSVTITDDDAEPTVTLSVDKTTLAEDGTDNPATVTATLSGLTSQAVTVDLAYTGGATLTNDYTRSGTQISIPALSTTGTVTVSAVQDALDEPNETVVVDIDAVSAGATELGTQQETITITDDDSAPMVTLSAVGSPIVEAAGVATVTATLSAVSGLPVTVDLGYSGTATDPDDYTPSAAQIVIAAGSLSDDVTVTAVQDVVNEGDETVVVDIVGVTNGTEQGTQQETITITDDDAAPTVTLSATGSPIVEASGVATVTATLSAVSGLPVTVDLEYSGTATDPDDYAPSAAQIVIAAGSLSDDVTVTAVQDALDEDDETVVVDIVGVTNGTEQGTQQETITITDDDTAPTVTLSATGSPIAEASGVATVTATLSAVSGLPVTVDLAYSGTATDPDDYTPSAAQIVIAAGSLSDDVTVTAVQDALDEDDETVNVDITNVTNGTESGTQQVTVTITDDDAEPTVEFTAASQSEAENIGTMTITVQLSTVSGRNVDVPFSVNVLSTADDPDDYTITASPVTITAGQSSTTITITVVDDGDDESDETVIVDMGSPTNATLGTTTTHTATITDNDP